MKFAIAPDSLTKAQFLDCFGSIYEHSEWVADIVFDQGITAQDQDIAILAARMAAIVEDAGQARQMDLLCAHPELAGKLAIDGGLTAESTSEQASAGLDKCSPEEFAEFQRLNSAYGTAFGHPFIIAVKGLTRADILNAFRQRIDNDKPTEFATALAEVHKIASIRLSALSSPAE
jgi:2-oxo-4-hydroxy-4-carboxy-5-ureidoimidazoline decarboxylase